MGRTLRGVTVAVGLTGIFGGCAQSDEAEKWKDKFTKEVNYHYLTQTSKNAEIQKLNDENSKLREEIDTLKRRVAELEKRAPDK